MLKFISTDSYICLDHIKNYLRNGGYVISSENCLDGNSELSDDEIIEECVKLSGDNDIKLIDIYPISLGQKIMEFMMSYQQDLEIHNRFVIGKSDEYHELVEWLKKDNYFSIGIQVFSRFDIGDTGYFVDKYFSSLRDGGKVSYSSDEGVDILTRFFTMCAKSFSTT